MYWNNNNHLYKHLFSMLKAHEMQEAILKSTKVLNIITNRIVHNCCFYFYCF